MMGMDLAGLSLPGMMPGMPGITGLPGMPASSNPLDLSALTGMLSGGDALSSTMGGFGNLGLGGLGMPSGSLIQPVLRASPPRKKKSRIFVVDSDEDIGGGDSDDDTEDTDEFDSSEESRDEDEDSDRFAERDEDDRRRLRANFADDALEITGADLPDWIEFEPEYDDDGSPIVDKILARRRFRHQEPGAVEQQLDGDEDIIASRCDPPFPSPKQALPFVSNPGIGVGDAHLRFAAPRPTDTNTSG